MKKISAFLACVLLVAVLCSCADKSSGSSDKTYTENGVIVSTSAFPENTILTVETIKEKDGKNAIIKTVLKSEYKEFFAYEITAVAGKESVQPDGTVSVTFPVPESYDKKLHDLFVFYVSDSGIKEEIEFKITKNGIETKLSHFSAYVVAIKEKPKKETTSSKKETSSAASSSAVSNTSSTTSSDTSSAAKPTSSSSTTTSSTVSEVNPQSVNPLGKAFSFYKLGKNSITCYRILIYFGSEDGKTITLSVGEGQAFDNYYEEYKSAMSETPDEILSQDEFYIQENKGDNMFNFNGCDYIVRKGDGGEGKIESINETKVKMSFEDLPDKFDTIEFTYDGKDTLKITAIDCKNSSFGNYLAVGDTLKLVK